jgi:hypothetical protein
VQPDQNTKLYRSYVSSENAATVHRHRGKSPRQPAFFFSHPELSFQASQLASLFIVYGLLYASAVGLESRYRVGALDSGALLCQAYEAYTSCTRRQSSRSSMRGFCCSRWRGATRSRSHAAASVAACGSSICSPSGDRCAGIAPRPLCRAMQPRPGRHLQPVHDS